jgi:uncharacterized protein (TIGR00369 family)
VAAVLAPDPESFEPIPPERAALWRNFGRWEQPLFPQLVGLRIEEIRRDYCRMRLPYRAELDQPAGVVHGGAIATLIDTVVVPPVGTAYKAGWLYLTVGMNISYLGAVAGEDAVAEGWVRQRGRSLVFCEAEVRTTSGRLAATGTLTYKVSPPREPS